MRSRLIVPIMGILVGLCSGCSWSENGGSTASTENLSAGACLAGGGEQPTPVNTKKLAASAEDVNVLEVTVGCGYINQPCASVTICPPGSGSAGKCQTISNLLVDTGSAGLRIFDNAKTSTGQALSTGDLAGGNLFNCVTQMDGSFQWGRVMTADVRIATATGAPASGSYSGILGVGLFAQDCGSECVAQSDNDVYYTCVGNGCTSIAVALAKQVTNPVALMPAGYNNGVVLQLESVPMAGASVSSGVLVLGIGTTANNTPLSSVVTYQASSVGTFQTEFAGRNYPTAFLDSGSNGIFFPDDCIVADASGIFIPNSVRGFSAVQSSFRGANPTTVTFNIADLDWSSVMAFSGLGGGLLGGFDWGLPFFLGRTVYVGIEGRQSPLGTGPYWAY